MASITFTGNIGTYHGLKFGQDGKPRTSFSAAETPREKNQQGEWVDGATTWFNVTLFGRDAEALDEALAGGKGKVLVAGRMKTREYEHNGESRESLDVTAESVAIVPRSSQQRSNSGGFGGQQPAQQDQWGGGGSAQADPWAAPQSAEVPF